MGPTSPISLPGLARAASARVLRIGYVPLTDAAPLVVADALGFFADAGVQVVLSREAAWAAIRDKLAFGALDGAHLLGPMAVAMAAGAGGLRRRLTITAGLARNGNTIILSHALSQAIGEAKPPLDASRFAAVLRQRAEAGLPPPTIAVVFPFSSHNYLLRHWLASGGLDPDHDLRLVVVPPPQVARALAEGAIEGFCAGEPWGSHAVASGAGRFALGTGDIWRDHPEKVLAFAEGAAERDAEPLIAATAAIIAATRWLQDTANRDAAIALLRERAFPDLPYATIAAALHGVVAAAPTGTAHRLAAPLQFAASGMPRIEDAAWWLTAMRRWGHLPPSVTGDDALAGWRHDLWQRAATRCQPQQAEGRPHPGPAQPAPIPSNEEPDA